QEIATQVQEITKKDKLLQEQAKLAAMGEMISAIAHQWRQPLNALNINIQNLDDDFEEGLIDAAFIDSFIQRQTKTINFMSKTIDDFRNFFQTDKVKKDFSIHQTCNDVLHLLQAQLTNHNISVSVEGDDFTVHSFYSEMQQVILNIITNAKDAIIETGAKKRHISIHTQAKSKIITLCDSGGGVKQELTQKIFEPYYTTKEGTKGTGIGLYMTQIIITDHMKGSIKAYNKGGGLCIEIDLTNAS
ncbi:MAG: sensor histidine kinase, partial [Campylobacterota bacterium]